MGFVGFKAMLRPWLEPFFRQLERFAPCRFRAKREHLEGFTDLCQKNGSHQGHNLALTVLCVPKSLDPTVPSVVYKGTSLISNSPPLQGHHRALGIVLL